MPQNSDEDLLQLEQEALRLKEEGHCAKAAELLKVLLKRQPSWEHGHAAYALACCEEDLGRWDAARSAYNQALSSDPRSAVFLGGYASFLLLHGKKDDAFQAHLRLLRIEQAQQENDAALQTISALRQIGKEIGMDEHEVDRIVCSSDSLAIVR